MAVSPIGIYPNAQGTAIGTSLRIGSADGTASPYLRFKTQSNTWTTADVAVTVDVITKSGTETINGYINKGNASVANVAKSSFTSVTGSSDANGWTWAYAFSSITGLSTLLSTLSYSGRSYDAIRLKFVVTCYYSGGSTTGSQTCYIGFIPTFTVDTTNKIYVDKNGLTIAYTASNWNRPNDRWSIDSIIDGTNVVLDTEVYGKVGSAGLLTIPKDKLKYIPKSGDTLTGSVRMVGSWMGSGTILNYLDLSTQNVVNKYTTRTPTLALVDNANGSITATVGQTGTASALDSVRVSLVGSDYVLDSYEIPINGSHTFYGLPINTPLTFEYVGYSSAAGELAASAVYSKAQSAITSDITSVAYDGGFVNLPYNISVDTTNKPETTVVKFAGRKRQTVGFGYGGAQTWRISCDIITAVTDGLTVTDEQSIRELPEKGVCILRFPDGQRAQVYITSASVTRDENGSVIRSIDIDAEEVA